MVRSAGTTASPPALSSCIRIRLAPQRGCFRRISTTTTSTSPLHRCGHELGRRDRSTRPATPVARYLLNHECNVCRDTPTRTATSVTDAPANTARTASNRCSTTDNATSTNPDLPKPDAPRGHHAQVAEERPLSSVYWHRTVKHLLAQGNVCRDLRVRTFFTGNQASRTTRPDSPRIAGEPMMPTCKCADLSRVRLGHTRSPLTARCRRSIGGHRCGSHHQEPAAHCRECVDPAPRRHSPSADR